MPTEKSPLNIAIVGAGVSGLYSAIRLANDGHAVTVIEKRPDPRSHPGTEGRSINFTLSYRGLKALKKAGVAEEAIARSAQVLERIVHLKNGLITTQTYGRREGTGLYSIPRTHLTRILLEQATQSPRIRLLFDAKCESIDREQCLIRYSTSASSSIHLNSDLIIGADGAFSIVRQEMQKGLFADYSREFFGWRYQEFTLDREQAKKLDLGLQGVHVWPRYPRLLLGLPNPEGTLTCNLIIPAEEALTLQDSKSWTTWLLRHFPSLQLLSSSIAQDLARKTWSGIMTTKTAPWHYRDRIVLVGDAAHTVVHFYAQGMNASLEDCDQLIERLANRKSSLEIVFQEYSQQRKLNTDLLAELSQDNFLTLSARAGSARYAAKNYVDQAIARWFPSSGQTLYTMIVHTSMPYVDAVSAYQAQQRVRRLLGIPAIEMILAFGIAIFRQVCAIRMKLPNLKPRAHLSTDLRTRKEST